MAENDLIRGDTKKWSMAFVDATSNPLDLSGCTVWVTAKSDFTNVLDDNDALFQHKIVISGGEARLRARTVSPSAASTPSRVQR